MKANRFVACHLNKFGEGEQIRLIFDFQRFFRRRRSEGDYQKSFRGELSLRTPSGYFCQRQSIGSFAFFCQRQSFASKMHKRLPRTPCTYPVPQRGIGVQVRLIFDFQRRRGKGVRRRSFAFANGLPEVIHPYAPKVQGVLRCLPLSPKAITPKG